MATGDTGPSASPPVFYRAEVTLAVYSRTGRFGSGRAGLHDDARCTAFGDLVDRFAIVGLVNSIQDLWSGKKKEKKKYC